MSSAGIPIVFSTARPKSTHGASILASPGHFVLDHMGYPDVRKGLDGAEFKFVRRCLDTGRCWIKPSPRFTAEKNALIRGYSAFHPRADYGCARSIALGFRLTASQLFWPMPNDADLLDLMLDGVPDEAVRHRIFVENPAEIFGFDKAA